MLSARRGLDEPLVRQGEKVEYGRKERKDGGRGERKKGFRSDRKEGFRKDADRKETFRGT